MATKAVVADLAAQYVQATSCPVTTESAGGVDVTRRIQAGEAVDIVVLSASAIDQLGNESLLLAGSRVDLVRSGIAIATRAGVPRPDIGSEDAVKRAVLAATSIGYSTGPSGAYLVKLFERWGIYEAIKTRIVQAPVGVAVGKLVALGEVELGFQQLSELLHLPGIAVIGPLPPDIQSITTFSAGVSATSRQPQAAQALIEFMVSSAAVPVKRRHGMEPA